MTSGTEYKVLRADRDPEGFFYNGVSEEDINRSAAEGWRVVSAGFDGTIIIVLLLERPVSQDQQQ